MFHIEHVESEHFTEDYIFSARRDLNMQIESPLEKRCSEIDSPCSRDGDVSTRTQRKKRGLRQFSKGAISKN